MVISGNELVAEGFTFACSEGSAAELLKSVGRVLENSSVDADDDRTRFAYWDGADYRITVKVEKL